MAKIEGIRVTNYRSLKDIALGRLWNQPDSEPLTSMSVILGKNGVGKSTLFDAFGLLIDILKFGIDEALSKRGGFDSIYSQGQTGAIKFQINYRQHDDDAYAITYEICIDVVSEGVPFISEENLFQTTAGKMDLMFMLLWSGVGLAVTEDSVGFTHQIADTILNQAKEKSIQNGLKVIPNYLFKEIIEDRGFREVETVEISNKKKLGLSSLGGLKKREQITAFLEFMEGWYLSYFSPDSARNLSLAGAQQHLNSKGDNLANVVQFMEREHKEKFQGILDRIAKKIPGIDTIKTYRDPISNQLHLLFKDKGFQNSFYAPQMSDGTLKVFAYLLLLEDPTPPPLICIEEPENGLYHKLLETLAAEFRSHATGLAGSSQLFITTHQPYFVDALEPNEVWILEKGADGFSTIRRASDDELVKNMVAEGLPLGGLWYSDYLDAR